jgi:DNA-binding HxlR family transcriptional regulator
MQPEDCPVEQVLNAVGAKWTPMVVLLLAGGTRRFGELRRALPGLSPRVLTDRLRTLELLGFLTRTVHAEVPPRVDYVLTARGVQLARMLERVAEWGTPPASGRPSTGAYDRGAVVALGERAPAAVVSPRRVVRPSSGPGRPAGPAA